MKATIRNTAVYNKNGNIIIGALEPGDMVLPLGEESGDVIIAYVIGRIKSPENLVEADEWHKAVSPVERFAAYAAAQIGCLYVWGAQGQAMTPALIKRLENSDKNYRRTLAQYEKHAAQGRTLVAYDCSGLIIKYLLDNNMIGHDTTANGLYFSQCTAITEDDLRAGDLVFRKYRAKNKMHHVGVYMGDGTVVHAKGRDVGVVREGIGATAWNRYGRLNVFAEVEEACGDLVRKLKKMQPYMRGDDVRAVQTALKESGFDPGKIDGVYGPNTKTAVITYQKAKGLEADGIVGPITWTSLMERK